MPAISVAPSKPRKKKQRKHKDQVIPLGDGQETHTYEHKDDEELRLESVLFGTPLTGGSSGNAQTATSAREDISMQHLLDDELFFDDSAPTPGTFQLPTASDANEQNDGQREAAVQPAASSSSTSTSRKKAAWVDPDDNQLDISIASDRRLRKLRNSAAEDTLSGREYESRLRRQFEKVHPVPEWAISRSKRTRRPSRTSSSHSDSEEEPTEDPTTGPIDVAAAPLDALPPTELAVTRLRDANQAARSDGPVASIEFHPSARVPVLMVSGRTQPNAKVDTQDRACDVNAFSPDGRTLAIVGRQGRVRLLDWASVSVVGEIKAAATVRSVWWHADNGASVTGGEMYTLDANAEICAWDTRTRRCLRRWKDDGGFGTMIAVEGAGRYTAIGSRSGIVNVYDAPSTRSTSGSPIPLKTLPHLTTAVTSLRFNHDAQILASASKTKKDQLKLIHTKTLTTFANWPTSGTPLGHVTSIDFSTGSEYLAIGNTRGTALLYSLRHYAVAR
ncbi:hypothetical protein FRC08_011095 [Ceratobasidium sp. 394]|nr:hypothetical protein FRC08_011095 [Ceratobasidium sp. 394]